METTGRTVAEALERALDQLGVAESDAEVVVLEEPRTGVFGLRRVDARIRVRVRPVQARAKRPNRRPPASRAQGGARQGARRTSPRRDGGSAGQVDDESSDSRSSGSASRPKASRARRQASSGSSGSNGSDASNRPTTKAGVRTSARSRSGRGSHDEDQVAAAADGSEDEPRPTKRTRATTDETVVPGQEVPGEAPLSAPAERSDQRKRSKARGRARDQSLQSAGDRPEGRGGRPTTRAAEEDEMTIEGQAALAEEFVRGIVEQFGLEATVASTIEDEHIRVTVDGDSVGYLIGPRGSTIEALQELTRTVVQRRGEGGGRVNVDVGGYRAKRSAALAQFAQKIAREVIESGSPQALEPMNAADRKVVHDAVHELSGVSTTSEGDDPRRYVVIRPSGDEPAESEDSLDVEDEGGPGVAAEDDERIEGALAASEGGASEDD